MLTQLAKLVLNINIFLPPPVLFIEYQVFGDMTLVISFLYTIVTSLLIKDSDLTAKLAAATP